MDRKTKSSIELPLRTLEDDELSLVAGACHGHRRRHHHHHHHHCGDSGGGDQAIQGGESASPAAPPTTINQITFIQIVTGNTAPVALLNIFGF